MVDPRLLERKLAALIACIERSREKRGASREEFIADPDRREIAAFNFFLAQQEALDLAAHLIADAGWNVPATAREHFEVLAEHQVIGSGLARQLAASAGARNLIAHAYGSIDSGRLYDELPRGLTALEDFARALAARP